MKVIIHPFQLLSPRTNGDFPQFPLPTISPVKHAAKSDIILIDETASCIAKKKNPRISPRYKAIEKGAEFTISSTIQPIFCSQRLRLNSTILLGSHALWWIRMMEVQTFEFLMHLQISTIVLIYYEIYRFQQSS